MPTLTSQPETRWRPQPPSGEQGGVDKSVLSTQPSEGQRRGQAAGRGGLDRCLPGQNT